MKMDCTSNISGVQFSFGLQIKNSWYNTKKAKERFMMYLFIHYPKCSTCQKAKKWLDAQGIAFEARHIVEENPTAEELSKWIAASGQPV